MAHPALKLPDYDDILALPDNIIGEIINGRLQTQPRPAPRHALASSALGSQLFGHFSHNGGDSDDWWILDEPELHINNQIIVPDLAGWRKSSMTTLPDTAWFETVPDWICEILSPGTAKIDRSEKMPIYAQWGVSHLWLIDPLLQLLEIYEWQNQRWCLLQSLKDDDVVSAPPFASHPFALNSLWP